jgi:hypothetical protein
LLRENCVQDGQPAGCLWFLLVKSGHTETPILIVSRPTCRTPLNG